MTASRPILASARVAAVAIGRNEGPRLVSCLDSLLAQLDAEAIAYVDSGSTDDSVSAARARGVHVVELDMSQPFTAARARNAGFDALRAAAPDCEFVQFIDGDCDLAPGWIEKAHAFLLADKDAAIACGRRREKRPEASVYNLLCDIEWNTPVGEATACGGDFLARTAAFESVGGFDPAIIAGEEPDLCFRLRQRGWGIHRLDAEMSRHDAAITRAGQWWRRTVRAGYAFAAGAARHGRSPERFWVRETARAVAFGGVLPAAALIGAVVVSPFALASLAYYPAQIARTWLKRADIGRGRGAYAVATTLARFPEFAGVLKRLREQASGRAERIIEYK